MTTFCRDPSSSNCASISVRNVSCRSQPFRSVYCRNRYFFCQFIVVMPNSVVSSDFLGTGTRVHCIGPHLIKVHRLNVIVLIIIAIPTHAAVITVAIISMFSFKVDIIFFHFYSLINNR